MNTLRGIAMMLRRDEAGLDRRSIEVVPSQKSLLRRCIFGIVVVAMLLLSGYIAAWEFILQSIVGFINGTAAK